MDLLFRRYASPMILLDQVVSMGCLSKFVKDLMVIYSKEEEHRTAWDLYLHQESLSESYSEFRRRIGLDDVITVTDSKADDEVTDLDSIIEKSKNTLKNFGLHGSHSQ